jgi:hypothetical protein
MGTFRNLRNNIRFIRKLKTIRVNRELSLDVGEIQNNNNKYIGHKKQDNFQQVKVDKF